MQTNCLDLFVCQHSSTLLRAWRMSLVAKACPISPGSSIRGEGTGIHDLQMPDGKEPSKIGKVRKQPAAVFQKRSMHLRFEFLMYSRQGCLINLTTNGLCICTVTVYEYKFKSYLSRKSGTRDKEANCDSRISEDVGSMSWNRSTY